ncbi:arsenite methyltransferase-like isoform X2 [Mizuhopecten yessoensis]|uniref:arsenite methyltransferase-like isoform X2 n=1 Tax=Mizuhopecten yessoensis TaxID=6573 RepID=UPI000B45A8EB|nr:arsenite methyltransferase-like isoform X2 [Mizuhopecten yessoensis]
MDYTFGTLLPKHYSIFRFLRHKVSMMNTATDDASVRDSVRDYYGKRLKTVDDLQTQACVAPGRKVSKSLKEAIDLVHEVVSSKYYGCGLVIPEKLEGMKILDLGSGSGRDCFALSKLVGPTGHVTGIDMTDEQLDVAREYIEYHTEKFGYKEPNIDFVKGYIEKLTDAGLPSDHYDIIVSNCTVNLSTDKKAVLQESYNVLKEGGELFFSDIYADRTLEESIRKHKVLWGEGFGGALWWKKLHDLASETGFSKPYMVSTSPIPVDREDFKAIVGDTKYASVTYRLFKLPVKRIEDTQVMYQGNIPGFEEEYKFDYKTKLRTNDINLLDGTIATALKSSRFCDAFDFQPPTKKSCGTSTCCADSQLEDPFVYLEQRKKKREVVIPIVCPARP